MFLWEFPIVPSFIAFLQLSGAQVVNERSNHGKFPATNLHRILNIYKNITTDAADSGRALPANRSYLIAVMSVMFVVSLDGLVLMMMMVIDHRYVLLDGVGHVLLDVHGNVLLDVHRHRIVDGHMHWVRHVLVHWVWDVLLDWVGSWIGNLNRVWDWFVNVNGHGTIVGHMDGDWHLLVDWVWDGLVHVHWVWLVNVHGHWTVD